MKHQFRYEILFQGLIIQLGPYSFFSVILSVNLEKADSTISTREMKLYTKCRPPPRMIKGNGWCSALYTTAVMPLTSSGRLC